MVERCAGGLWGVGPGSGGRAGMVLVGVGQAAVCGRHWNAAGAEGCGRIHAVDVTLLRFDGALVCGAAAAGGNCSVGAASGAGGELDAEAAAEAHGCDDSGGAYGCAVSGRGAYPLFTGLAHAELQPCSGYESY